MAGTVSDRWKFASLKRHFHMSSFWNTQNTFLLYATESSQLFHKSPNLSFDVNTDMYLKKYKVERSDTR